MNWDQPKLGVPLILVLGAALGLAYNALHKQPIPWIAEAKATVALEDLQTPPPGSDPQTEEGTASRVAGADGQGETSAAADSAVAKVVASIPESEFPITIHLAKAKEVYDSGAVTVLDARDAAEYAEGHLKGAICAPYDEKSGDDEWLAATAASAPLLLVYCGGGDCELSLDLGFALTQAGHRRVLVFEEGYPAWADAGYPVSKGDAP